MSNAMQYSKITAKQVIGLLFQNIETGLAGSWVTALTNEFPSNTAAELYGGLGLPPAMREWIGGRQAGKLNEFSQTVANKDFELTLEIMRKDLRRDKTGQILMRIGQMAERAVEHGEILLASLINNGTTTADYTGSNFFSNHSSYGNGGSANNTVTSILANLPLVSGTAGTQTAPSAGSIAYSILAGIQQMYGFKDDQGQPANGRMRAVDVHVPTTFMGSAMAACSSEFLAQGISNPLFAIKDEQGITVRPVVNPRITATTAFYIFRTDSPIKPFLNQVEEAPLVEYIGEGTEHVFKNNAHLVGVKKSGNMAPWDFTKACKVTLQTS